MRILGVISLANHGGAQIALLKLSRHLRERGHEVEVVFLYGDKAAFREDLHTKVLVGDRSPGIMTYLKIPLRLIKAVRNYKPDVILSFLPLANTMGALVAKSCAVKKTVISHRSPVSTYGGAMRKLDRAIGSVGLYSRVVCVSNAVASDLRGYPKSYSSRLTVVHNGVEPLAVPSKSEARLRFGLGRQEFAFVALGRLQYQKNYHNLLSWFSKTREGTLLIAGEGPDRIELEQLILALSLEHRVRLLGNLPKAEARELLAAADAFLQPSRFEGQSNSVLEAMLAGLPIILSDIPEQRETVETADGANVALLIGLQDDVGWVEAMELIRSNADLRARLGIDAKQHAKNHFSVSRMIDQFEQICEFG